MGLIYNLIYCVLVSVHTYTIWESKTHNILIKESSNESNAWGKKHNGWLFSHLFANLFLTYHINEINAALDFNSIQLKNN